MTDVQALIVKAISRGAVILHDAYRADVHALLSAGKLPGVTGIVSNHNGTCSLVRGEREP